MNVFIYSEINRTKRDKKKWENYEVEITRFRYALSKRK